MGQLFSRQAAPSNAQDRRRRPTSGANISRHNGASNVANQSRTRAKSSVQHHDYYSAPARLHHEARTRDTKAHSSPPRPSKSRSNGLKGSQTESRRARKDTLNFSTTNRQERLQAEVSQAKNEIKAQSKTDQHSSSLSNHREHRHSRPKETKECIVCTDTRSLHRFPGRPPTTQCTHEVDVCRRCLRTWIQSESATKIWNEINCPICSLRLQYKDMREFAPRDVFQRYDKLRARAALESIPNFRWCIYKGCKSGQVQPPHFTRFRCIACKRTHCVEHNIAWHKKETCREYDYRTNKKLKKAEEVASKMLLLETTKKCPGCGWSIEKSYGCDHMTCSQCKAEFCWQCLAPYAKKNRGRVMHRPRCDYFDPNRMPEL